MCCICNMSAPCRNDSIRDKIARLATTYLQTITILSACGFLLCVPNGIGVGGGESEAHSIWPKCQLECYTALESFVAVFRFNITLLPELFYSF